MVQVAEKCAFAGRECGVSLQRHRRGAWFWSWRSGGAADGMSSEGSMTLVVRKRETSRGHVLGRELGSGREE